MNQELPGAVCMDCIVANASHEQDESGNPAPGYFCTHWRPETWVARGYERGWGDAAVMNWPHMEVLRREEVTDTGTTVIFVVLAPYALRRPLQIGAAVGPKEQLKAWGTY